MRAQVVATLLAISALGAVPTGRAEKAAVADSELAGTWVGAMSHEGEAEPIALGVAPDTGGTLALTLTIPVVQLHRVPIGRYPPHAAGDSVRIGPFRFLFDRAGGTLRGSMPRGLVPVYEIPIALRKAEQYEAPARSALRVDQAKPVWTFEAGSPLWAGATF